MLGWSVEQAARLRERLEGDSMRQAAPSRLSTRSVTSAPCQPDELAQLWNVFRGDMSLVGPRLPLPTEVDLYEEHHYTRFDVSPA